MDLVRNSQLERIGKRNNAIVANLTDWKNIMIKAEFLADLFELSVINTNPHRVN